MKSQKQAVVEAVSAILGPNFTFGQDVALNVLSPEQLESVKVSIALGLLQSTIEYSKDRTNVKEVTSYARSMVMNHLKKAKELNGNVVGSSTPGNQKVAKSTFKADDSKTHKKVNLSILPEELASYVKTL